MTATHRQWDDSRDQLKYWGGALLIHVLIGALLVGFNWRKQQPVVPQLAINAVVVDRNTLNQLVRQRAIPSPPAEPDTRKQEEAALEKQRQERLKQEQAKQEQLKQEQLKQEQLELQRVQEKQRQVAEAEKQKQLDQQRKAQQVEQQKQQQEAEKKRLAEIQQKQREAELKRQAEADARAQSAKEAELKAQLAAEEGQTGALNSGAQDRYVEMIRQKVMRRWIKPPSAKVGIDCDVAVSQAIGGAVLSAKVLQCNGDPAVRLSIENAVLNASPLPTPEDSRVFLRNFVLKFKPTE